MKWPTVYASKQKQIAFENACECLYWSTGRAHWVHCGLSEQAQNEVWKRAFKYMAEEE